MERAGGVQLELNETYMGGLEIYNRRTDTEALVITVCHAASQ